MIYLCTAVGYGNGRSYRSLREVTIAMPSGAKDAIAYKAEVSNTFVLERVMTAIPQ